MALDIELKRRRFTLDEYHRMAEVPDRAPGLRAAAGHHPAALPRGLLSRCALPQPGDVALLIEVADTSLRYDRHVKGPLDAEAGVRDYWIVDLDGVAVEVHRDPAEGAFRLTERVARGGALTPLAFGDISFTVAEMLG